MAHRPDAFTEGGGGERGMQSCSGVPVLSAGEADFYEAALGEFMLKLRRKAGGRPFPANVQDIGQCLAETAEAGSLGTGKGEGGHG